MVAQWQVPLWVRAQIGERERARFTGCLSRPLPMIRLVPVRGVIGELRFADADRMIRANRAPRRPTPDPSRGVNARPGASTRADSRGSGNTQGNLPQVNTPANLAGVTPDAHRPADRAEDEREARR